ncbi:uncharacterized protein LOC128216534 isoform X2 [Mya arenaria]|uniref:uncharacterized protein LOC128216534 isoform X2 n=1 Tax=Mya arenaria TaxID=6604 RepID=UPI0022E46DC7|nr:uncharacterized protein LOC128216534 isoform X2 [Mya arenaria]
MLLALPLLFCERTEHSVFHFNYDPETGFLVGYNTVECFVAKLTDNERRDVHTDAGLYALELQMIKNWIGKFPEISIYHDDHLLSSSIRQHICYNKIITLIDRSNTPSMTGTTTILAPTHPTPHVSSSATLAQFVHTTKLPQPMSSHIVESTVVASTSFPQVLTMLTNATSTTLDMSQKTTVLLPTQVPITSNYSGSPTFTYTTAYMSTSASGMVSTRSPTNSTLFILFTQSGRNTSILDSKTTVQEITATSPHTTYLGNKYSSENTISASKVQAPLTTQSATQSSQPYVIYDGPYKLNALLNSKLDPHSGWNVTGQIGHMSTEVQTFCTGPVYVLW